MASPIADNLTTDTTVHPFGDSASSARQVLVDFCHRGGIDRSEPSVYCRQLFPNLITEESPVYQDSSGFATQICAAKMTSPTCRMFYNAPPTLSFQASMPPEQTEETAMSVARTSSGRRTSAILATPARISGHVHRRPIVIGGVFETVAGLKYDSRSFRARQADTGGKRSSDDSISYGKR